MISNSNTSCKTNLSFFKKRVSGIATPRQTIIPQKSDPVIFLNPSKEASKNLPEDFEIRVKFLEHEMEKEEIKMDKIRELLEIYAEAVEYYESINDPIYMTYKQKMLFALNKPNVTQALNKNNEKNEKNNKNETNLLCDPNKQIQTNIAGNTPKSSFQMKTEQMLKMHEIACLKKKEIIHSALKSQMADINIKLESRKFSKINKKVKISKKDSLFLDMDLIYEGSSQSNLSTKSEENIENVGYAGCQTTRVTSQPEIIYKTMEIPLTSRAYSSNELKNLEEIIETKENMLDSQQEKIKEIIKIYDEKIKIFEGRFFKNNEKNEKKDSKLFVKLLEKLNEEKNSKIKHLQNELDENKN